MKTLAGITTGTNLGTAYAIKYPFKVGKFYSITITASETSASQTSNPLIEPCFFPSLPDPNNTDPIDCGAVPQTNWAGIETNRFAGIFYATKTPKAYTLTTFQATLNLDYMIILATQGATTDPTNVLINKIVIVQSNTITPTFSLSPASVIKTCGTSINQTFTVAGSNIPTGSSVSYTWDFGSASNRWFLNGSPVGQTITTSTNTLTLTDASCDIAPSNINVTANVNGTNYTGGKVTVTMKPFVINGPNSVCTNSTSSDFTIANLGCSPSVTWSPSLSGLININSPNSLTTSISYLSSGSFNLTAAYSSACGSGTLSIPVISGSPAPRGISNFRSNYGSSNSNSIVSQYAILGANHGQTGDNDVSFNYSIYDGSFTNYNWTPVSQPSGTNYQVSVDGLTLYTYVTNPYTNAAVAITMNLQANGPCGVYSQNITSTAARISGWGGYKMAISPNPATGTTRVSIVPSSSITANSATTLTPTRALIYVIKISDQSGVQRKSFEYPQGISAVSISLAGLPSGIYQVSGFDGISWNSQQIIIK